MLKRSSTSVRLGPCFYPCHLFDSIQATSSTSVSFGPCLDTEELTLDHSYIWNTAENATTYTRLTYGVMFKELAMNMRAIIAGSEPFKLRLYSGHDGSMVRLASGLGFGKPERDGRIRWPGLGSEVILEVSRTSPSEEGEG